MNPLVNAVEAVSGNSDEQPKIFLSRKGYLRAVMQVIACSDRLNEAERNKLLATEMLYGVSDPGVYGMCLYDKWYRDGVQDVIQISAFFGESPVEKWITIAHELAHVLAGRGTGHNQAWKMAARRLGLANPKAQGIGCIGDLDTDLVTVLQAIPLPTDGQPICDEWSGTQNTRQKTSGCKVGVGTRNGKSQGPGSGRLRLWICECDRPYRVRLASDHFNARCQNCGALFKREGTSTEATKELVRATHSHHSF
jgi:hypothetical protein